MLYLDSGVVFTLGVITVCSFSPSYENYTLCDIRRPTTSIIVDLRHNAVTSAIHAALSPLFHPTWAPTHPAFDKTIRQKLPLSAHDNCLQFLPMVVQARPPALCDETKIKGKNIHIA